MKNETEKHLSHFNATAPALSVYPLYPKSQFSEQYIHIRSVGCWATFSTLENAYLAAKNRTNFTAVYPKYSHPMAVSA